MARSTFTEADVRRAVKGALVAGLRIGAVEVLRDGTIRILPSGATEPDTPVEEDNTCDSVFGCDT